MKVNITVFILLIALMCSCERTITDFKIEGYTPKIVLNGFAIQDSLLKCQLSESLGVLEKEELKIIDDATVILYEDNAKVGTLQFEDDLYTLPNVTLKTGVNYKIVAVSDGFESVQASFTIPQKPEIINLASKITRTVVNYGSDLIDTLDAVKFEISITQNPNVKDYVLISAEHVLDHDTINPSDYYDYYGYYDDIGSIQFITLDPSAELETSYGYVNNYSNISGEMNYGYEILFNDKLSKENISRFSLDATESWFGYNEGDQIVFKITSVSEAYYNFLKTYGEYDQDNIGFFSENVFLYSNIENGLGLMYGASVAIDTVTL